MHVLPGGSSLLGRRAHGFRCPLERELENLDPSRRDAGMLCFVVVRRRMQANHRSASVSKSQPDVSSAHFEDRLHCTLVVWFQLGELRRCAIGLTSESGR